jgi:hypothetical protein
MKLFDFKFYFQLFALVLFTLNFRLISSDAENVFKSSSDSVVKITTYNQLNRVIKKGSGVVIGRSKSSIPDYVHPDRKGYIISNSNGDDIISNFHVVAFASKIIVESKSGIKTEAGIVYLNSENDIAILRTDEKVSNLELKIASKVNVGQKVFTIGNPSGLDWSISDGIISGFRTNNGSEIIQFTAPISSGSSGGGLFNTDGDLIGITTSQVVDAQNLNFSINIVNQTDFDNESIRKGVLYHPEDLKYDNWAIGYFYLTGPGADKKYSMNSNKNYIIWSKYKAAIDLLDTSLFDKTPANQILKFNKGMATEKQFFTVLFDAKQYLNSYKSIALKYDIVGLLDYSYSINGDSEKYRKDIERLRVLHGNALCLESKYLLNQDPGIYTKDNLPIFQRTLLDLVKEIPSHSKDTQLNDFASGLLILCHKYKLVDLESFLKSKGYSL